jgi:hypothetical protein
VDFAVATAGPVDSDTLKIAWIKNTSKLSEMWISQGLMSEAKKNKDIETVSDRYQMQFDENGNFLQLNPKLNEG